MVAVGNHFNIITTIFITFLELNLHAYTIPSNPNCPDLFLHLIQIAKKTILFPVLDISVFLFSCLPHSLLYKLTLSTDYLLTLLQQLITLFFV